MELNSKIYVAGHKGLVGSSIVRKLESLGYSNIITLDKKFLDLRNESQVIDFFSVAKPEYVFLAAAKVGGINYNKTFYYFCSFFKHASQTCFNNCISYIT